MTTSEKIAEQIKELLVKAIVSRDEDRLYLSKNLAEKALDYTQYRLNDNFASIEEKGNTGSSRTMCHNAYMDALNMFLRFEKKLGNEVPDIDTLDRKDLGDIGNLIVAKLAIRQR
jgi:hypothetical protein